MKTEFLKAFLKLRSEIGPIVKKASGHQYKYADLAEVHRAIDDLLHENGFVLTHTFRVENDATCMDTTLFHESGECLTSTLPLSVTQMDRMNFYQAMGSAITYQRRYAITALFALPTEDDDGKAAAKVKADPPATKAPPKPKELTQGQMKALGEKFYAPDHESYYISVPVNGGDKPDYLAWAGKYATMAGLAPTLPAFRKLQEDNEITLKIVRERCASAVKMKVDKATEKCLAAFSEADEHIGPLESEPLTPETPF